MRTKVAILAGLLGSSLFFPLSAFSADAPAAAPAAAPASPHTFTGNVGFVSDYRFRGISQTWKRPAVQGGFDYSHSSGVYVGTWASNVSSNSYVNGNMEWDFYGGYKGNVNDDLSWDVGLLQYYYPGAKTSAATPNQSYNTTELYGAVTYKWFNAKYSHTLNDYFGVSGKTNAVLPTNFNTGTADAANGSSKGSGYLEFNGNWEFADKWAMVAHVGRQRVKNYGNLSYTDYKLGVTKEYNGFVFGLAYVGTNAKREYYTATANGDTKDISKDTAVLSVSKTF